MPFCQVSRRLFHWTLKDGWKIYFQSWKFLGRFFFSFCHYFLLFFEEKKLSFVSFCVQNFRVWISLKIMNWWNYFINATEDFHLDLNKANNLNIYSQSLWGAGPLHQYFVQLGFSSNVTLDTVILTNFIKGVSFCGGLYFWHSSGQTFLYWVSEQLTKSPVAPQMKLTHL